MTQEQKNQALKTLVKGAGFVYVGMILSKIFTYLYRIIVARIGTSEYGALSLGLAIINMIMFIPLLGMDEGIVRYVSYYLGLKDQARVKGTITPALKISGLLSILFSSVLFVSSEFIAVNILKEPALNLIIKVLAISIPFYVLGTIYLSIIKAYKRMDYWVFVKNIVENTSKLLISFILILAGFSVIGAAIGYTLSLIISFIIAFFIVEFKFVKIFRSKIKSIKSTKRLLTYSWPIMFHIIIAQLLGWTDTLMLGFFKNSSEVGIYNAALPTAHVITMIPAGIFALFIPIMTNLYAQKKKKEFISIYQTSTKWNYYFLLYTFIILVLFSKEILQVLFGSAYISGSLTFIVVTLGYFIYSLSPGDCLLKVIAKTKLIMFNTIVSTTLNIILNYIMIPKYGMLGGAIASAIALLVWSLLGLFQSYYITKIHPFKKGFLKLTIIGAITFVSIFFLKDYLGTNLFKIINSMIVGFLIYFILIIITNCLDREDTQILKAIKSKLTVKYEKL